MNGEFKSKLSQLRQGKPASKNVMIGGIRMAVVILSSDTMRNIEEQVTEYQNENKGKVNEQARNQYFDQILCYHALRNPDNLDEKMASSVNEIGELLDIGDIAIVTKTYGDIMINKSPKIELLTEEQFDELKKFLGKTTLNELNIVSLVHLANFHQASLSEV